MRLMILLASAAALLVASPARPASIDEGAARAPVNVLLVHGAYADGSSWAEVIPILQRAGLNVVAVQNPLTSFADDVATTTRALDRLAGPVVLVGHSYGGMVISEVGVDPDVAALVYVAARAPEAGEDYPALAARFPAPPVSRGIVREGGFLRLGEAAFLADFAGDVDPGRARVLFAVQKPIADTVFGTRTTQAAWRTRPVFYAISTADRTTSPELQRFVAGRMDATTVELDAGHLSPVSRPGEIADLIMRAAVLAGDARPVPVSGGAE